MKEIICPNCGHPIKVSDADFAEILSQVRNEQFKSEVDAKVNDAVNNIKNEDKIRFDEERVSYEKRLAELERDLLLQKQNNALTLEQSLNKQKEEIQKLRFQVNGEAVRVKLAINEAVEEKDHFIAKQNLELSELHSLLKGKDNEFALKLKECIEKYETLLKFKDEEIMHYKDFKLKLSTKMIGESLEQYIYEQFESLRATAFQSAYFAKDNDVIDGGKGDFIFRDFSNDGVEYISIMFELKNEADTTATKHKNEDFFDKLHKDRVNHGCEYAVLVSMLEPESEYYNQGIVDVSYRSGHEKMYSIRPQNFISIITLLRNAALKNIQIRQELELAKKQNVDVTDFENKLETFKDSFGKNVITATAKFDAAIEEIDKTIQHLTKVKEDLLSTSKNLNNADKKLEDLTIKKLTRNNPTMKQKFDELEQK